MECLTTTVNSNATSILGMRTWSVVVRGLINDFCTWNVVVRALIIVLQTSYWRGTFLTTPSWVWIISFSVGRRYFHRRIAMVGVARCSVIAFGVATKTAGK